VLQASGLAASLVLDLGHSLVDCKVAVDHRGKNEGKTHNELGSRLRGEDEQRAAVSQGGKGAFDVMDLRNGGRPHRIRVSSW